MKLSTTKGMRVGRSLVSACLAASLLLVTGCPTDPPPKLRDGGTADAANDADPSPMPDTTEPRDTGGDDGGTPPSDTSDDGSARDVDGDDTSERGDATPSNDTSSADDGGGTPADGA